MLRILKNHLRTIRNADKILVIDGGEIVESGTHAELIAIPGGFYAHLNAVQYSTGLSL